MKTYKLRIDVHVTRDVVIQFLETYSFSYIVGFENIAIENPHCHALLHSEQKEATLRAIIRKRFGGGNGSYSLKFCEEQYPKEYIAYTIKENHYEFSNIPDEIMEECRNYDAVVKEQIKIKKESRKTILQKIEEKYFNETIIKDRILLKQSSGNRYDTEMSSFYCTESYVVDSVISYYKESGTLIREFMIVSLCQTLCLKYCNDYERRFRQSIFDKVVK